LPVFVYWNGVPQESLSAPSFSSPGEKFKIVSGGPDGEIGGEDDITN